MSLWTNKDHRTVLDDADSFAHAPSGGRLKQWLAGAAIPFFIVLYGIACLRSGETEIAGRSGTMVVRGDAATSFAVAYIALGFFSTFTFSGASVSGWNRTQSG